MPISVEDAFAQLHSLDIREPLRRFQPKTMLVAVDKNDAIVKTQRLKESPKVEDLHEFADSCGRVSIFIADTENYPTLAFFQQIVRDNGEAIRRRLNGGKENGK